MTHRLRTVTFKEFQSGDFEVTAKISTLLDPSIDRSRKGAPSIRSARVSRQRAHKNLFEILRSNNWSYFLTLTFGIEGREDDSKVIDAFMKWRKFIKRKFPDMIYVAVPEYHLKGSLHFHLVVGNVSAAQLDFVYTGLVLHKGESWKEVDFLSSGFEVNYLTGEGLPIYNVGSFDYGFSTATEVRSSVAVTNYIGKYISKASLDPRFYNRRRFFTSHNVQRPLVSVDREYSDCSYFDESLDSCLSALGFQLDYDDPSKFYRKYGSTLCNVDLVHQEVFGELPID